MRIDYICNTLGKAPMYGLTITNNIQSKYTQSGKEIFKFQRFEYKGATVKPKKVKYEVQRPPDALVNDSDSSSDSSNSDSAKSIRLLDSPPMNDQNNENKKKDDAEQPSSLNSPVGRPETDLKSMSQLTPGRESPDAL